MSLKMRSIDKNLEIWKFEKSKNMEMRSTEKNFEKFEALQVRPIDN